MRTAIAIACLLSASLGIGCSPSLGPCDEDLAARYVVDGEGRIVYAGQALLHDTCASGRCHSEAATGSGREGVPHGLDYDLPVGTVDDLGRPDEAFLERLQAGVNSVGGDRAAIWAQVERGYMPPYDTDVDGLASGGHRFVDFDLGRCSIGDRLPSVRTPEGRAILREWLACGAPVVEASDPALARFEDGEAGQRSPVCEEDTTPGGDLFMRVYDDVLATKCAGACHAPGGTNESLDFSTPMRAFEGLTTQTSTVTEGCDASIAGALVDTTNVDASYLLHKMSDASIPRADRPICGKVMPVGDPPLVRGAALVRAWIEAGAPPPM